jgi:hypothetical protein
MRNYSFIKVFVAALTIAFAVTMGTVPVSAQNAPPMPNVTQVRMTCSPNDISDLWCGTYDKIAPYRWLQRRNDGKVSQFVQNPHNNTGDLIMISDASRGITVFFNFGAMVTFGGPRGRTAFGTITSFYEVGADNSPETCSQQTTAPGAKCTCDLRTLRPLQGAVGMEEVKKKAKDIKNKEKTRLDLAYDPIKIVRGPNGLLYVTDHHHGARAWLEERQTMGTCQIQSDTISTDPTQFWVDLKDKKLVRLFDQNGNPITEAQLPTTLRALPDDPYRTLAWRVRKSDGFCRALMTENKEFAEFQWADWFRKRPELPYANVKDWAKNMLPAALRLAKDGTIANDPAEKKLPGYRGDKLVTPTPCNDDPD